MGESIRIPEAERERIAGEQAIPSVSVLHLIARSLHRIEDRLALLALPAQPAEEPEAPPPKAKAKRTPRKSRGG